MILQKKSTALFIGSIPERPMANLSESLFFVQRKIFCHFQLVLLGQLEIALPTSFSLSPLAAPSSSSWLSSPSPQLQSPQATHSRSCTIRTLHTHCTARPRCITLSKIQNNRQFKERLTDYYACALSCRSSLTIFIIALLYNLRILTQLTPHLPAMSLPSTETFHPSLREGQGMHLIQH